MLAHLDTVHPIGMIEKDLKIRREGDSVFGPGIYDMKAGGYIAYYALRHLIRAGQEDQAAGHLPVHPRGGGRQPDLARAHRGRRARRTNTALVMEPGRDGDKVVTSRKGVGRFVHQGEGRAGACRRPPSRTAAAPSSEMARADPAHRGQDRLCARHHLQCRPDQRRHRRQRRAGGMHGRGRPARAQPAARRGDDALVPRASSRSAPTSRLTVSGGMNRPPYQKDAGIAQLFGKAQAIYREIGKELNDVPLTGGGSDGNFTAALGIPTLDGLGADGKGAHAAYEQIYFSSLMPRTYLCARLLETLD